MEYLCVFGAHTTNVNFETGITFPVTRCPPKFTHCTEIGIFAALPPKNQLSCLRPIIQFCAIYPIPSLTSHFRQYVVVHCFTVFPVWRLSLCTHVTWALTFSFQCSMCCCYIKKMISPRESASWTASMTLYWNFHIGTSKASLGDFFCRKLWAKFLLACFGMQDVCTDNCHVEQMKEMFLPPFYHLPFKRIIWQHLVWSVHNTFTLTVAQQCRCFYFMMCPHVDCTPTSISSWAMVKRKTTRTPSHLIAKRWFHWGDFFFAFFPVFQKMLVYAFLFSLTLLCLHPVSYRPKNVWKSFHWSTICPCTYTGPSLLFCLTTWWHWKPSEMMGCATFCLTKFEHFYSIFVEIFFDMNMKEYTLLKWAYCRIDSRLFFQCVDDLKFLDERVNNWMNFE